MKEIPFNFEISGKIRKQIGSEMVNLYFRDKKEIAHGVACGCYNCRGKAKKLADWWELDMPTPMEAKRWLKK